MTLSPQVWLSFAAIVLGLIVTVALLRRGGHSVVGQLVLTLIFIALGVLLCLWVCGLLIFLVGPLLHGVD